MPRKKPALKPRTSQFYIASGRVVPVLLVDEEGEPAALDTLEQAREAAQRSFMTRAMGGVILEWNEDGYVDTHEIY